MIVNIGDWVISDWATRRQNMLRWCYEHFTDYDVSDDRCIWRFANEEDALMFILRWQNAK